MGAPEKAEIVRHGSAAQPCTQLIVIVLIVIIVVILIVVCSPSLLFLCLGIDGGFCCLQLLVQLHSLRGLEILRSGVLGLSS